MVPSIACYWVVASLERRHCFLLPREGVDISAIVTSSANLISCSQHQRTHLCPSVFFCFCRDRNPVALFHCLLTMLTVFVCGLLCAVVPSVFLCLPCVRVRSTSISNTKKVPVTCVLVDAMPRSTDDIIKARIALFLCSPLDWFCLHASLSLHTRVEQTLEILCS